MENNEMIGSTRCKHCGRTVRVLPDAKCSCQWKPEIDMSKIKPLSKKDQKKLDEILKQWKKEKQENDSKRKIN